MFLHLYKYRVINLFHMKDVLWWNILFPILLALLFFCAFSNLMNGNDNALGVIDVAVVTNQDNKEFTEVLDNLSNNNDDQLFSCTKTDENSAKDLLEKKTVSAIIYVDETPYLSVKEDGIKQTITQSFISQYLTQADLIKNIMKDHPEKLKAAIDQLSKDVTYNHEVSLTKAAYDPYVQYFFALIAMTCLYGTTAGADCVSSMQANMSELGKRREASPEHKFVTILADFLGTLTLQFASILLMFFFLIVVLGINFGDKIPLVILTGFMGTLVGISFGMFFSSIIKGSTQLKSAICMTFSMICSFLSGLMIDSIKDSIEHNCPIVNRLNPAALISDSLYSLNMYDTYTRFGRNMLIMLVMAVVLCFISYLILRRNKYASL